MGWDQDLQTVLGAYDAWEKGDITGAVSALHPDVVWVEPDEFPGGGRRIGPAAVADYLHDSRASWTHLVSTRTPYRIGGNVAILHEVTGTLLNGSPGTVLALDIFTLTDGIVVSMQAYSDPSAVLATVTPISPAAVVSEFWRRIQLRNWAGVSALLAPDVELEMVASGERFVGAENLVAINREYPDGWSIQVQQIIAQDAEVVSEVTVPQDGVGVFRAVSFWTVEDGLITRAREYWWGPDLDEAPSWRAPYRESP